MPEIVLLSHVLSTDSPVYEGNPPLKIAPCASFDKGDKCNTYLLELFNHNGTHLDAPNHFNPSGRAIADLPPRSFIFERPVLVDVPKGDAELISQADLLGERTNIGEADLLLLRTGFCDIRESDPGRYIRQNPGIGPDAAAYIVDELPSVRAVGIDSVSAGARQHGPEGTKAHQVLCGRGRADGRSVLIIEDVDLRRDLTGLRRVIALPLLVAGIDSAPVTVIGEIERP